MLVSTWKPCLPLHHVVSSFGGISITDTMSPTCKRMATSITACSSQHSSNNCIFQHCKKPVQLVSNCRNANLEASAFVKSKCEAEELLHLNMNKALAAPDQHYYLSFLCYMPTMWSQTLLWALPASLDTSLYTTMNAPLIVPLHMSNQSIKCCSLGRTDKRWTHKAFQGLISQLFAPTAAPTLHQARSSEQL